MTKISPNSMKAVAPAKAKAPAPAVTAKPKAAPRRKAAVKPAPAKAGPVAAGAARMANAGVEKTPAAPPVAEPKEKSRKPKLVRDSFTMPEAEYQVLGDVKKACLKAGVAVKKSELLRVGVALIRQLGLTELRQVLAGLAPLKPGRPKLDK